MPSWRVRTQHCARSWRVRHRPLLPQQQLRDIGAAVDGGPLSLRRSSFIGCLLAPLAVIGGWGKTTLTDTDAFVATYAPLAHDPVVQTYIVDQASTSINANLDVEQLTSDVIDGIKSLGVRPRASVALDALKAPATQGIQNLIRNGVNAFVTSDAFAQTWERALEISHTQLLATLNNDPNALIAASADGTIGVQLGPIVEDVKAALVARGIDIAARIPPIDRTIPIAQSDQIPTVQAGYRLIVAIGTWLPWVALILLTAGVLVARRRSIALVWAAIGLSLSMLVLLIGFGIGRALLLTALPGALVPGSVTTLLYDTATAAMKDTALSALVLGAALALIAWLAGPFRGPSRLRALYNDGIAGLRQQRRAAWCHHRPGGCLGICAAPGPARDHRPSCGARCHPASPAVRRGDRVDSDPLRGGACRAVVGRAASGRGWVRAAGGAASRRGLTANSPAQCRRATPHRRAGRCRPRFGGLGC